MSMQTETADSSMASAATSADSSKNNVPFIFNEAVTF